MFGLDVTYQVLARAEHRTRMEESGSRAARQLAPIMSPLPHWSTEKLGPGVVPMHDPCTLAWLIRPELFKVKHVNVEVETASPLTYGDTVVDFWGYSGRAPNVYWAHEANGTEVMNLIVDRICSLP